MFDGSWHSSDDRIDVQRARRFSSPRRDSSFSIRKASVQVTTPPSSRSNAASSGATATAHGQSEFFRSHSSGEGNATDAN